MWYNKTMAKMTKSPKRSSGSYTIGREGFSKISAVEGIKPSRQVDENFREFDKQGLSPAERRRALARKYGAKH
jgi:hypothetical protein